MHLWVNLGLILIFIQCSILPRRVEGIYTEYIQTTYTNQIDKDIVRTNRKNVQIKWKQIDLQLIKYFHGQQSEVLIVKFMQKNRDILPKKN